MRAVRATTPWARRTARLAVAPVALLLAGACGVPTDSSAEVAGPDDVPFGLLDEGTTSTTSPDGATPPTGPAISLCFVDGDSVVPVPRAPADLPGSPDDLVDVLAAGPTAVEAQRGLSSALPDPIPVLGTEVSGGVAEVDLDDTFADLSADRLLLAVAQIVCTLTSQPGVGQVGFTLEGERIEVPRQDGSLTRSPVTRDDYAELFGS